MRRFILVQSSSEIYPSSADLALGGLYLNKHTPLIKTLRTIFKRHSIANIDLVRTYMGLMLTTQ